MEAEKLDTSMLVRVPVRLKEKIKKVYEKKNSKEMSRDIRRCIYMLAGEVMPEKVDTK